jgi:hypothetical protein
LHKSAAAAAAAETSAICHNKLVNWFNAQESGIDCTHVDHVRSEILWHHDHLAGDTSIIIIEKNLLLQAASKRCAMSSYRAN